MIGVLLTVAFAVSFTTALQRLYLRAWRRPPGGGLRNKGRGVIWVGRRVRAAGHPVRRADRAARRRPARS